jgi:hypothetical protein
VVRIHSPRPTFSITSSQQTKTSGSKKGPFLDPTLTRVLDSICLSRRVLIHLQSDDLLGPYQEV